MAQRVQRELLDDLDGSAATRTVRFGYAGREYAIDLNDAHANELDQVLAGYLAHARRANGARQRRGTGDRASRRSQPAQVPLTSAPAPDRPESSSDDVVADFRAEDTDAACAPPGAPETASALVPDGEGGGTVEVAQWPAEADEGCAGAGASSWS